MYDQTDFVRFNQMLTDINWNEKLCNFDDVDDMCEEFSKTFLQISSACIPSKKLQFKVSLRIMGSNKVLVLPLILVGLSITFLRLKIFTRSHISDHDAAIAFIKCPEATSKSFTREIWLSDQTDFVRFNQMLIDINWNEKLCKFDDVDDMCEELISCRISLLNHGLSFSRINIVFEGIHALEI
jgi:hypothetical protein